MILNTGRQVAERHQSVGGRRITSGCSPALMVFASLALNLVSHWYSLQVLTDAALLVSLLTRSGMGRARANTS